MSLGAYFGIEECKDRIQNIEKIIELRHKKICDINDLAFEFAKYQETIHSDEIKKLIEFIEKRGEYFDAIYDLVGMFFVLNEEVDFLREYMVDIIKVEKYPRIMTPFDVENKGLEEIYDYRLKWYESLEKLYKEAAYSYYYIGENGLWYDVQATGQADYKKLRSEILFKLEQIKNEKYIEALTSEIEELKKEVEEIEIEKGMSCVYAPPEFLDGFSLL